MAGIPKRGIPTTYPAPPLDPTASGLTGPRPFSPVPCKSETFSLSVISFMTSAALSSGERLVFIQGAGGLLGSEPACADAGNSARLRIAMQSVSGFVRSECRNKFIVVPLCVCLHHLYLANALAAFAARKKAAAESTTFSLPNHRTV